MNSIHTYDHDDIPTCLHCSLHIMCSDVVRAVYSVVAQHHVIGFYAKTRGTKHYVHRDCFDDLAGLSYLYDPVQDTLVATNPQIVMGQKSSPCVCACCSESIDEGEAVWSLTYGDLSVTPKRGVTFDERPDPSDGPFPDTYICSTCGDTYVFGEG